MQINRRDFLKKAGIAGVSLIAGGMLYKVFKGDDIISVTDQSNVNTRWAMLIDMKKCAGKPDCTDCIFACNKGHNVPEIADIRREIKWIWKADFESVFPENTNEYTDASVRSQNVIVACNHCENPPCVRVCPVGATWKRADGIVMMDHHRCIGCRYCMAACPYGSRSFNWKDPRRILSRNDINAEYPVRTKGVVEKCNFCAERIDTGKQPLCVEACTERAILFGNIADSGSEIRRALKGKHVLRRKAELGTNPEIYYLI
ncbi:MAG TPA: 4Fe-4S dicluster domain-containing protein [Spirochaetota bacterium]|nr:4Fe-4S dicluster domain-containing protein [Spirochaetota bacterium]HPQ53421.1 4Fe-4S dicluster domain-containing protein [Spirochaetota bacterium]